MVDRPYFFCMNPAGNILITDHSIKILSPYGENIFTSGQLIHEIGKKGGRGEMSDPCGIRITQLGTIFVISNNLNFGLQSF